MPKNISNEHILKNPEYTYRIRIAFTIKDLNNIVRWDLVCAKAVDLFGLPGNKYITDISTDWMDWIFKNEQDALIFKLKFSEVVVDNS